MKTYVEPRENWKKKSENGEMVSQLDNTQTVSCSPLQLLFG
jgi:hypothetical protein